MDKCGARHPEVIDFLAHKDGVCSLYVVQSEPLDDELTLQLQEKLNNYLTYALDGQLAQEYPELADLNLRIQLDLQFQPVGIAAEFLEKVRPYIESEGVEFHVYVASVQ